MFIYTLTTDIARLFIDPTKSPPHLKFERCVIGHGVTARKRPGVSSQDRSEGFLGSGEKAAPI
jgi:hypothetical protein